MATLEQAAADVPGHVGIAARHLDSREELHLRSDEAYFTASTFKVPILAEVYRQVDAGLIDPAERVKVPDELRAPGSGVLKELGAGLQPTVHDLALLMIIISDNTATDTLYHMVGRERLNETMQDLGLSRTRLPMSCREMLYSMCGVDTEDIERGNEMVASALALQKVVPGSPGLSEDHGDVSSPADMIKLLQAVYDGEVHSPGSREALMDILRRQQATTIIPADLPPGTDVAHKTGGVPTVRCDVGIVFSPSGPYTIAIMAKNVTDVKSIDRRLAAVSRAVYDHFNP